MGMNFLYCIDFDFTLLTAVDPSEKKICHSPIYTRHGIQLSHGTQTSQAIFRFLITSIAKMESIVLVASILPSLKYTTF